MNIWKKIVKEKIEKGFNKKVAMECATLEVKKLQSNFNPEKIIGLTEKEGVELLCNNGYTQRIISRDNKIFPINLDYRPTRCNLIIKKNIIFKIDMG